LNGFKIDYYEDGMMSDSTSWRKGMLEGKSKEFFENGLLQSIGNYSNDVKEGNWLYFHVNGKLEKDESYINGKLNGIQKQYEDDGHLWRMSHYLNGTLTGETKDYFVNGNIQSKMIFDNGMPASKECFYKDGHTRMLIYYRYGQEIARNRYDEDGVQLTPVNQLVVPIKGDTIKKGETFIVKINFIEQDIAKLKDKHIILGQLDENENLISEEKDLSITRNTYAIYSQQGMEAGIHHFTGVLRYTKPNGRIVEAPFRWGFYVNEN